MSQLNKMKAAKGGESADAVNYAVVPNAMPSSQDAAPYLGRTYVAGSVVQNDVIAELVAQDCPFGAETVNLVLNHTGLYLLDRMPQDPRTYDLVFAKLRPAISGTFATADAAFDPERNELYVAAVPSDRIREALANGSPTRIGGAAAKLSIGNVRGPSDNTIRNGEAFEIIGTGITLGIGDEHAALQPPKSAEPVPVTLDTQVSSDDGCQRIMGRLDGSVAACQGARLKLWTHGTDPDSSLKEIVSPAITVLAGETPPAPQPTLTDVFTREDEPGTIMQDEAFQLTGTNLTLGTGGKVEAQLSDTESPETWHDLTANASNLDAERIRLSDLAWETLVQQVGVGAEHSRVKFRVTIGGRSAEIVAAAAMA